MTRPVDLLLVSLGTTRGWRLADRLLLDQLEAAGASTAALGVRLGLTGALRRGYPANDLVEMVAARRAIRAGVATHRPRAAIVSTTTAAMLAPPLPVPYAVRLDAPALLNRTGAASAPLRALERRGLSRARAVLPLSRAARAAMPPSAARSIVVPPPIVPSGPAAEEREPLAVAYVPDPKAKGLDVVCAGWAAAGVPGARLRIFGIDPARGRAHLERCGVPEPAGVEWAGMAPAADFRSALRAARAYVGGARWEDFGQAPLEALADGALLATVPSGGPFEALALARELEPALVAEDLEPRALGAAVRAAFELPEGRARDYRGRAADLLAPYRPEAVRAAVADELLPALLG